MNVDPALLAEADQCDMYYKDMVASLVQDLVEAEKMDGMRISATQESFVITKVMELARVEGGEELFRKALLNLCFCYGTSLRLLADLGWPGETDASL